MKQFDITQSGVLRLIKTEGFRSYEKLLPLMIIKRKSVWYKKQKYMLANNLTLKITIQIPATFVLIV